MPLQASPESTIEANFERAPFVVLRGKVKVARSSARVGSCCVLRVRHFFRDFRCHLCGVCFRILRLVTVQVTHFKAKPKAGIASELWALFRVGSDVCDRLCRGARAVRCFVGRFPIAAFGLRGKGSFVFVLRVDVHLASILWPKPDCEAVDERLRRTWMESGRDGSAMRSLDEYASETDGACGARTACRCAENRALASQASLQPPSGSRVVDRRALQARSIESKQQIRPDPVESRDGRAQRRTRFPFGLG